MLKGEKITPYFSMLSLSAFLQQGKGVVLEEHPIGYELLVNRLFFIAQAG